MFADEGQLLVKVFLLRFDQCPERHRADARMEQIAQRLPDERLRIRGIQSENGFTQMHGVIRIGCNAFIDRGRFVRFALLTKPVRCGQGRPNIHDPLFRRERRSTWQNAVRGHAERAQRFQAGKAQAAIFAGPCHFRQHGDRFWGLPSRQGIDQAEPDAFRRRRPQRGDQRPGGQVAGDALERNTRVLSCSGVLEEASQHRHFGI